MGGHPPHGIGPGGFTGTGGAAADGADPAAEAEREVRVHLGGGGKSEGGV